MSTWAPNIENFSHFTFTGSSTLSVSQHITDYDIRLTSLELTLNAPDSSIENITMGIISHEVTPPIELIWYTKNLLGIYSLIYTPDISLLLKTGDYLTLDWANVNNLTYTATVNYVRRFTVWRMDNTWK